MTTFGKEIAFQVNNMLVSMDGLAVIADRIPDESMSQIIKLAEELNLDVAKHPTGDILVKGEKEQLYALIVKIAHRVLNLISIA